MMILLHRRLFWKIYLTLIVSLFVVAALVGSFWWVLGETPHDRWRVFRNHLTEQLVAEMKASTQPASETIRRLGDEIASDISLYGPDGALITARGAPVTEPGGQILPGERPRFLMLINLPDHRTMLVRLNPPPDDQLKSILMAVVMAVAGVGLAAFPMTERLTRQLESLRLGMARWGQGDTRARVDDSGIDEVASVARTFNTAAERISHLLASQKALLANASHELRSPLARLRLAVDLWFETPDPAGRNEIVRNLSELNQLVEEILLCSRLDHPDSTIGRVERVDLLGLAAEEAARVGAVLDGEPVDIEGNETLLRRLVRNLLENGLQHGRPPVRIHVSHKGQEARLIVSDDGDGIAPDERERVFEPFYRPADRSEAGGGWGLGLSLVRQIATRHGGRVRCEAGAGGGTAFIVQLVCLDPQLRTTSDASPPSPRMLEEAIAGPEARE